MTPLETDLLGRLETLVAQVDELLGADLFDQVDRDVVANRVYERAEQYAARLEDPDADIAHRAVIAIGDLVDPWNPADAGTPLGVAVASTEKFEGQLLSQKEAATLLGVSRQRVNDLLKEKRLDRVGMKVTRTSIARQLKRRAGKPLHLVERIDTEGRGQRSYLTDTGEWTTTPVTAARRFSTLREACRVADGVGAYARGVDVYPFGEPA